MSPNNTEKPLLVKRGDMVHILAKSGDLQVQMRGVALRDGKLGEAISVKNKGSGRIVEGQVTGAGEITVTF